MIWVTCSILSSSLLFVIFKLFESNKVHRFTAVVFNYLFAGLTGLIFFEINVESVFNCPNCLYFSTALGIVFIALFNLIGFVTKHNGASIAVLANKMAFVIPVVLSILVFSEPFHIQLLVGISIGLLGLFLAIKPKNHSSIKQLLIWPSILFVGSGLLDFLLKIGEQFVLQTWSSPTLTIAIFASAFFWGSLFGITKKTLQFNLKNISWGALLGVPNFFSIYFLFEAIKSFSEQSSVVFPLNNVGIIVCTSLLAFLIFREKLSKLNLFGIALCIVSIILLGVYA